MIRASNYWTIFTSRSLLAMAICGLHVASAATPKLDEASRREQLQQIRLKQIPLLEQFLTKYQGSPRVAESLFRLGEAYFETAKYFQASGDSQKASQNTSRALETLNKLIADHPQYERMDEALFVLANTYIESKQMDKAGELLAQVAERYPQSIVIGQSSLLLGDHYFAKNDFQNAEKYYLVALRDERTKSYVSYKLAWANMSLGQSQKALSYFEKVIAMRAQAESMGGDYSKEAAREMIFAAYDVHGASHIVQYLQRALQDAELVKISLSTLARGLVQRSQFEKASDVYAILQSQYPQSSEMGEWVAAQLKAEEALGRSSNLKVLLAKLQASGSGDAATQQIFNTAKKFHAAAKKMQEGPEKVRQYDQAINYYSAIIESAPEAVKAQSYFYLGEAQYDRNMLEAAARSYEASAMVASDVQSQAIWNWFLTSEKLADGFSYKGKELKTPSLKDEAYLRASEHIQNSAIMSADQKRKAMYQSARLLYQLNDAERALPLFQKLADEFASTEEGRLSAQLVLDIYNLKQDYKNVAHYARAYQAKSEFSNKGELGLLEQQALIKTIQAEESAAQAMSGDQKYSELDRVAKAYMDFVESYPRSKFSDAALWSAIQHYGYVIAERRESDFSRLQNAFEKLTIGYSGSKYSTQAIALMGRFLAYRKLSKETLTQMTRYRSEWEKQWLREPAEQRGALGMLVYKMTSSENAKAQMASQFSKLPQTNDNKEAYATGELYKVKSLRARLDALSLKNLATLKRDTKKKMDAMETLYQAVTALVKLQVAEPAVEGLKILGDGYMRLAQALRSAPNPKQLEGENLAKYREIVESSAKDIELKGQDALRLAREKAQELGIEFVL